MSVIDISGLRRSFQLGEEIVEALRGVDLRISVGEYLAIVGPSGSGKTTLMNLIGCLDTPTAGRYVLDGIEVQERTDDELAEIRNSKIGFVFRPSTCCRGPRRSTTSACRCSTAASRARTDAAPPRRRSLAST